MIPSHDLNSQFASEWDDIKAPTKNKLKKHFIINHCIDHTIRIGPLLLVLFFQWPGAVWGAQHIKAQMLETILIANTAIDQIVSFIWSFILSL